MNNYFNFSSLKISEASMVLTHLFTSISDKEIDFLGKEINWIQYVLNVPSFIEINGLKSFKESRWDMKTFLVAISFFSGEDTEKRIKVLINKDVDEFMKCYDEFLDLTEKIENDAVIWAINNSNRFDPYKEKMKEYFYKLFG